MAKQNYLQKIWQKTHIKILENTLQKDGEYLGIVVNYPKLKSGVIVQLDNSEVTCLTRVPANFNNVPHLMDKVLIRITEIYPEKKLVYGVLKRIIGGRNNEFR